ncbi:hypothetical protein P7C70_g9387, partial [Phenoliferia sp. Uapishka_3]
MEEQAQAQGRPQEPNVHFNTEIKTNSIELEYDPPEVAEDHCEYESGNVRVDEFEVNQTKRPRSAASTDNVPLKSRNNRNYRPRESLFEELGVPRAGEMSDKENDTEMKDVPKRRQPQPAAPKPKLESPVEAKSDPRAFLDKVLEQPITVPMHFMLANSPELVKMLMNECKRKRTPVSEHDVNHLGWDEKGRRDPRVNAYKFEGPRKPYYAGVLAFANIMIEGEIIKALLDNGSMICMMQDDLRKRLGLPIRTDGSHRVRMAGGSLEMLLGISENVPISIGGVTTLVHFFISKGGSNPILLGQNFLRQVEARFSYHSDGSVLMGMTYKGRQITVEVTGRDESRYLSRVPGEARDYDSAAITMMDTDTNDYPDHRGLCYMCHNTHEVCISNVGQTPCSGRSNVLRSLLDQARTSSHEGPRATPSNRNQGNYHWAQVHYEPTSPRPEEAYRVRLSPSTSATYVKPAEYRSNSNAANPDSPKKPRTRNRRPLKRNPREDLSQLGGP